ncbi:hypothetical protein BH23GEM9_BH23GEM9_24090 [soil metagenome]
MTSGVTRRGKRYLADAGRAFESAPVEVTVAVILAAAFSYAIESDGDAFRNWVELAICGALLIAAAWTATLLHALGTWSSGRRWAVTLVAAAAVAAYGVFVLDLRHAAEAWRSMMLVAAAVLWLAAAPYFGRAGAAGDTVALGAEGGTRIRQMRVVTGRAMLRVLGALLYSAALFAGLALALGAVNTLFELNFDGRIYAHAFGWIFLVLAPWIVVGGLAEYTHPAAHSEVAGVVHRMSAFLVPPLFGLYCAILYAYTLRIALTGEIPKNMVSPMVLAAGVLALLALLLFDPPPSGSAGDRTLRAAPPLFVPLALLGIWTVTLRVGQYGWTEFRLLRLVLLVVLGLLAAAATVQLLRRQKFSLNFAPLALAAVLILGAAGPWSVQSISRRSQQARLMEALQTAGVVAVAAEGGAVSVAGDTSRAIPNEVFEQINSTARYLIQHFGPDALPRVLAGRVDESDTHNVAQRLGLSAAEPWGRAPRWVQARLPGSISLTVGGITVHRVLSNPRSERPDTVAPEDGFAVLDAGSAQLRIRIQGDVFSADAARVLQTYVSDRRGGELSTDDARLDVTDADGRSRGTLIVLEISVEYLEDGEAVLRNFSGLLLLDPMPVSGG